MMTNTNNTAAAITITISADSSDHLLAIMNLLEFKVASVAHSAALDLLETLSDHPDHFDNLVAITVQAHGESPYPIE